MTTATDEFGPSRCPAGHAMDPDEPPRGWRPCWCARSSSGHHGHRLYRCPTCAVVVELPTHVGDRSSPWLSPVGVSDPG